MSCLIPRREIDFILRDWLKLEKMLARAAYPDLNLEIVDAFLDLSEKLAADQFLSHYREADIHEPRLEGGEARILPAASAALHQYPQAFRPISAAWGCPCWCVTHRLPSSPLPMLQPPHISS